MKYFTRMVLLALPLMFFSIGYAQTTETEIRSSLVELRMFHTELKAQVDAGTLSPAEARVQWHQALERVRALKKNYFDARIAAISDRLSRVSVQNPERLIQLETQVEAVKERRAYVEQASVALNARVESGELQRQQAHQLKVDLLRSQQHDAQMLQNTRLPQTGTSLSHTQSNDSLNRVIPSVRPEGNSGLDFRIDQDFSRPVPMNVSSSINLQNALR